MGSGARILVVDDDADMLHLISLRLTAAGYQVSEAESGEAALLCFRENRPQLVVTDLRMGGMDGLALFEHLQSEAQTLPVIILTAHGTIPDAVAATQRGVFSFLTKPFDGRELLRRVADAIRLSPILDPEHAAASWRSDLVTVSVRMEGCAAWLPAPARGYADGASHRQLGSAPLRCQRQSFRPRRDHHSSVPLPA